MTVPFNPLAGDWSTTGWLAPDDDYLLKISKVEFKMIGNDDPKPVLSFSVVISGGPFDGKRPPAIQIWEPMNDFSQAGRIIMAAKGYVPGKEDQKFAQENSDLDLTLDASDPENMVMGSGYTELVGAIFAAYAKQVPSKKDASQIYQQYKNIRPISAQ